MRTGASGRARRVPMWVAALGAGCLLAIFTALTAVVQLPQVGVGAGHADNCVAGQCQIQHIVIIDKENRTFDEYFGTFPGADGATTYKDPQGHVHPLNHQLDSVQDVAHWYTATQEAYDNGKMDKFSLLDGAIQNGVDESDAQLYESDIPNYWQYARRFTLDDKFFSTVRSGSFPNHLYSIAGTAGNSTNNPSQNASIWGCDTPPNQLVTTVDQNGKQGFTYPCFDFQTLADLLDAKSIDWKYYAPSYGQGGYSWSAFDAIKHIRYGPDWKTHVVETSNFEKDAAAGRLPPVSWLIGQGTASDHPPGSVCAGENWTVRQLNALMSNKDEWNHTVVILMWDDFGGFYDHVPPPLGPNKFVNLGFRVPAVIISPFAKQAYIDHTQYDFTSVVRFVEDVFHLGTLHQMDEAATPINNSLDLSQKPLDPLSLQERQCPKPIPAPTPAVNPTPAPTPVIPVPYSGTFTGTGTLQYRTTAGKMNYNNLSTAKTVRLSNVTYTLKILSSDIKSRDLFVSLKIDDPSAGKPLTLSGPQRGQITVDGSTLYIWAQRKVSADNIDAFVRARVNPNQHDVYARLVRGDHDGVVLEASISSVKSKVGR